MSLNRHEQMLHDYLHAQPEERRHWQHVVQREAASADDAHAAALILERELWRYYMERAEVTDPFRDLARREGLRRVSLRNLAEFLLRLWGPLPAKPKDPDAPRMRPYA